MSYAVIFDMDGVLADTEALIADATIRMFRDCYGAELTFDDLRPFIGTGAVRYVVGPAENAGIEINLEEALAERYRNFVALLDSGACRPLPGAIELVNAVADSDAALGLATSSPQAKAEDTWRAISLPSEKFDALISGDMVTHKKPHPEIYLLASEVLGVAPKRCVVIEDAITGVTAAKAAGMQCLAVTNSFPPEDLRHADRIVESLEGVSVAELLLLAGKN